MITYKKLHFTPYRDSSGPIQCDPIELKEFVEKSGLNFSNYYLDFLIKINGGRVYFKQNALLPVSFWKKKHYLSVLKPFAPENKWEGIQGSWELLKQFYPKYCFPIGIDSEDCHLIKIINGGLSGTIFLLDEQKTNLKKDTTQKELLKIKGITFLANSFEELIEKIIIK